MDTVVGRHVRPGQVAVTLSANSRTPWVRGLIAVALASLMLCAGMGADSEASAAFATWLPAHAGDFPDPNVLFINGIYYAFATQNFSSASQTVNIQTSTSSNGITWAASSTDALPTLPGWARPGNTWSPSVSYVASDQRFVMYYTATQASNGDQCIGRAVATAPLGPYVDGSAGPVICQDGVDGGSQNYGGSIDPFIFTDKGQSTLIWKSDGNRVGINSYIWSQPLSADLLSVQGAPTAILANDQNWQNGIVEGPDMVDHGGTDYLFYSGNNEGTANYAIGYAVCSQGPNAACADGSNNPILVSSSGMSGPGGPSTFLSPSGTLDIAFSAWKGTTIGYFDCGIRPMYVAQVSFSGGTPVLAPATSGGDQSSPSCSPPPSQPGYWQVASDGGIFTFGSAQFYGSTGALRLNKPIVGMAATPDRKGYWLVASDGGVFSFGDAQFFGSTGAIRLNQPIIAMLSTFDGRGYWLIASDGGVFTFGDAQYFGSLGGAHLPYPITAMAPSFLGGGYWLVTSNGQVIPFGNAQYYGSPPFAPGGYRITGMAGTQNSSGYWLASANGNLVNYGNAQNYGSPFGSSLNGPIVGITTTPAGTGYWLQGSDGGIFTYGDAAFEGSMGGKALNAPMVGIASANP